MTGPVIDPRGTEEASVRSEAPPISRWGVFVLGWVAGTVTGFVAMVAYIDYIGC